MLQIQAFTCKGCDHVDHNEDALIVEDLGGEMCLLAIMDGCSSGEDSHFASTLIGKILRKLAKEMAFRAFAERLNYSPSAACAYLLEGLFQGLKKAKADWMLDTRELLATLILTVLDKEKHSATIQVIGDGWLAVDGVIHDIDQGNKPDYLAYHLGKKFEDWRVGLAEPLQFEGFGQLVLASDGVHNFRRTIVGDLEELNSEELPMRFLEMDGEHPQGIRHCLKDIKKRHGMEPCDDFSMIWAY